MNSKEKRAQEIQRAITEVLNRDWDPIGVSQYQDPLDEYDGYVGAVYRKLASGATREDIARYLCEIETEQMGLGHISFEKRLFVADKLKALDISLGD